MHAIVFSLFVAAPALVSAAVMPVRRGFSGFGTWYITTTGNAGSCGSLLSDSDFTVAVNSGQYNNDMCGKTISITANGKTTQAKIMDLCPIGGGNCNYGDLDLSPSLFSFFASQNDGKIPISWDFSDGGAPPPAPAPEESKKPEESPKPEESKKPEESAPAPTKPQDVTSSTDAPVALLDVTPTPSPSPSESPAPTESAQSTPTQSASESAPPPPADTPTFGKVFSDAMGNKDVPALAQAFIDLGNQLKGPNGDGH